MIGWLTWRVGAFILFGILAIVSGSALFDGISNRATIETLKSERDIARGDLKEQSERLGVCQGNYRSIEVALNRQNESIRDLSEKSATATAKAAEAAAAAAKDSKAALAASQRVLALPRPAPPDACEAAAKVLRGAM